jgi:hypothetical protein
MARTSPQIKLEEISGNHHPCLEAAQSDALPHIARALVVSMRGMLANGLLVIRDGKIIPNEK